MFALMLFGVFMPIQVVLLPMSQVLAGWARQLDLGPVLVHIIAGLPSTTLFFRNYTSACPTSW